MLVKALRLISCKIHVSAALKIIINPYKALYITGLSMVRKVCLEDVNSVTMMRSLKQMKHDEDLCDFTVIADGTALRVHKCIIAAGSPYFKAMVKHDTLESRNGKVEMKEVDAECVKSCIDFMYSGSFEIQDGKTDKLLHVAVMIQLQKVTDAIVNVLVEELDAEKFFETRNLAKRYSLQTLSEKCNKFYEQNFMAISAQAGFENEENSLIVDMVKSKDWNLSEEDKLTACLLWVGENPDRKENLLALLKLVNLKKVPAKYLRDLVETHPLISTDLSLYKILSAPLLEIATRSHSAEKTDLSHENISIIPAGLDASLVGAQLGHVPDTGTTYCPAYVGNDRYPLIEKPRKKVNRSFTFASGFNKQPFVQQRHTEHSRAPPFGGVFKRRFASTVTSESKSDVE